MSHYDILPFSANNRIVLKNDIKNEIVPLIDTLNERFTNLLNNSESRFKLMEGKIESLASLADKYTHHPTTRNSHGGQRKKNKTRKFRKSSH